MNYIKLFFKNNKFLILLVIFAVLARNFIFMPVQIEGTSMAPNFEPGEKGISFIFLKSNFKRGDVVVIDNNGRYIIKRIVGLPGEHIKAENNIIYIDGKPLEEDYIADSIITSDFDSEIKEDEVFCLGDNRQNSSDSRSHGPFKITSIVSKGFFSLSSVFNSEN